MNADLAGKQVAVWGKKGMGKSFFTNFLMTQTEGNYACFDPLMEHTDYRENDVVVRPTTRRGEAAERQLAEFVEFAVENRRRIEYIFVDEIDRFHNKRADMSGPVGDLVDFSAHYDMGFVYCARRPVKCHTDLQELADYQFIFRVTGVNDVRRLDNVVSGLGERAASLDKREFIMVKQGGSFERMPPVSADLRHDKGV